MKKNLVSIIIPNYNGLSHLEKCLPSLLQVTYPSIEIIVVDNNSHDGSVSFIEKNFPKVVLIQNTENNGYAKANNQGFLIAKGEYILFLNNDTIVTKGFIKEMVGELQDDVIGGVQAKILLMDEQNTLDSVGAFLTNSGFLYHYGVMKQDSAQYNKRIYIYSAKGACMLFKREVLEKILLEGSVFDDDYFAYFEETDMCHRVWLAGYRIVFCPEAIIYHKMGGTSTKMNNAFIQYHSYKNRINAYIKNLSFGHLITLLPVHVIACEVFAFSSLLQLRLQLFLAVQKAIMWNIFVLPKTLHKRKIVQQKIRKVSDQIIFKYIYKSVRLEYYIKIFSGLRTYRDEI